MSKATPGPWEILVIDGSAKMEADSKIRVNRIEIDQSGDNGHPGLAIVPLNNGVGLAKNMANARLIAAAPELLASLKLTQARLCEHCPQNNTDDHTGDHTDECLEAQELIARAEGRTE